MLATAALTATLLFALPSLNATLVDTTLAECGNGDPLEDLSTARLYGWPADGGSIRLLDEHDVTGREGQPDSFAVSLNGNWHFWVTATDTLGQESCASAMIYIGTITGVDPPQPSSFDRPIAPPQTFDVRGRLVRGIPKSSGVYFRRDRYESGSVVTRRFIYLK